MRDNESDFTIIVLRDIVRKHPEFRLVILSSTIDTELMSKYFDDCNVITLEGRNHMVKEYFLEDCVEICNFKPDTRNSKSKYKSGNVGTSVRNEVNINLNQEVSTDYKESTRNAVAQMSENDISFKLIKELLELIDSRGIPGSVLIFLPGCTLIASLMHYLQKCKLQKQLDIIPLHSQLSK